MTSTLLSFAFKIAILSNMVSGRLRGSQDKQEVAKIRWTFSCLKWGGGGKIVILLISDIKLLKMSNRRREINQRTCIII